MKHIIDNLDCDEFIVKGEPIHDLDTIPIFNIAIIDQLIRSNKDYHITTSRGCPYRCNFCLGIDQRSTKVRFHSIHYIINYMKLVITELNITSFNIVDDIFILNKERVYQFCDEIEKLDTPITLSCFTHAGHGDQELYTRMKMVGFNSISMGIEHGNDRMLKYCGKNTTKEKIEHTCQEIYMSGINLNLTYIIGNLTETNQTITETVDFAIYLHNKYKSTSYFSYMQPLPGSQAYKEGHKHGNFNDYDINHYSNFNPVYVPNMVTIEHMIKERRRGRKYANPHNLVNIGLNYVKQKFL